MESARSIVLDTLWLRSAGMQISENRAQRVRTALRDVLTGARSVEQFLKAGGKHPPSGILLESVDLRNDLSEEHTVVHVIARDLQGLLYLMTRAAFEKRPAYPFGKGCNLGGARRKQLLCHDAHRRANSR